MRDARAMQALVAYFDQSESLRSWMGKVLDDLSDGAVGGLGLQAREPMYQVINGVHIAVPQGDWEPSGVEFGTGRVTLARVAARALARFRGSEIVELRSLVNGYAPKTEAEARRMSWTMDMYEVAFLAEWETRRGSVKDASDA